MISDKLFQPDLIIEATNACNKSCKGCYAPNVVVDPNRINSYLSVQNLTIDSLIHSWPQNSNIDKVKIVTIRGGEPTLNPKLNELLEVIAQRSNLIYLETNGDWIQKDHPLLSILRRHKVIVKLSIDSMHESKINKISDQFKLLTVAGIKIAIGITERTEVDFNKVLSILPEHYTGEVFKQPKATKNSDLVKTTLGVITTRGEFKSSVTSRFKDKTIQTTIASLVMLLLASNIATSRADAAQTITIGIAANFSAMSDSTSNPYSNYFRNAVEMAFDENKEALLSKNIIVHIKEFDYSDNKIKVLQTATHAAKSDAIAVIGYIYSSDALLAGPIFNKNKILMLSPTATADRFETLGRYVRRTCFSDSYQGQILAEYAWSKQKIKKVAIISVADCAYCQSLRDAFKSRFEKLGGNVVLDRTILSEDEKFDNIITELKKATTDAIFIPNYEKVSATIISSLYDAGVKPKLWLGGDGWGNSVDLFYRIVGKRKFKAYTISHWHRDLKSPKSTKFSIDFTKRFGKAPVDTAVLAYDAAKILIQSLLNSQTVSRENIITNLEKINSFESVTGKLTYPPNSRTPVKPAVLLKLENGKITVEQITGG